MSRAIILSKKQASTILKELYKVLEHLREAKNLIHKIEKKLEEAKTTEEWIEKINTREHKLASVLSWMLSGCMDIAFLLESEIYQKIRRRQGHED